MPLSFTHRREDEVPTPSAYGRVNQDLEALKSEMRKLASGMVLEIETGSEGAVRSAKTLVSHAGTQLGTKWQHWSAGSKVFAKPAEERRRRVRRAKKPE